MAARAQRKSKEAHFKYRIQKIKREGGKNGKRDACSKICYLTKQTAKSAVKRLSGSGHKKDCPGEILMPYFCVRCDAWHIGHR